MPRTIREYLAAQLREGESLEEFEAWCKGFPKSVSARRVEQWLNRWRAGTIGPEEPTSAEWAAWWIRCRDRR